MEFNLKSAKQGRIIGLDYGMKRIGIALSDTTQTIATPLDVFRCEKKMDNTIINLLHKLMAHQDSNHYILLEIVIGLPLMLSGKKGLLADEVIHFVELLKKSTPIPITLWDERLTTVQADRSLREGNFTRKRRSQMVDTVAATLILQSYLDSKKIYAERRGACDTGL